MKYLLVTPDTTIHQLKQFLEQAGPNARIRADNGMLYCRDKRKGSSVSHAAGFLSGQTQDKRKAVMQLVGQVFKNENFDLKSHTHSVLSPSERARLNANEGDLKVDHLMRVFTGTVEVGGETYSYQRLYPIGKGSYGKVYKATGDSPDKELAVKFSLTPVDEDEEVLGREAAMQRKAYAAAQTAVNYVAPSGEPVRDGKGWVCQPMALALCSANKLLEHFRQSEDGDEIDCVVAQTVRDWVHGLQQVHDAGLAYRDYKPENLLLSKDGVFQLTDFGTASDPATPFQAVGGRKGSSHVTGNGGNANKSPEWIRSELPRVEETYYVGQKDDVFALGVAVFRLIHGNRTPFQDPKLDLNKVHFSDLDTEEMALAYADSGLSFSDWHLKAFGQEIPIAWRDFFNMSLHSDPNQRASTADLQALPVMWAQLPMSEADMRAQLVEMASAVTGAQ